MSTEALGPRAQVWSRPWLQRRELGPMLHDLGHTIYDVAENRVLAEGISPRPTNQTRLAHFGGVCIGFLERAQAQEASPDLVRLGHHIMIEDLIRVHQNKPPVAGRLPHQKLTHYGSLNNVLQEGLASGVVMPLQLYRTIKIAEQGRRLPALRNKPRIDAAEAAGRIMSDEFQAMLQQLATNPNSALGTASSAPGYLREDNGTVSIIQGYGLERTFERDRRGRVTGFTPGYLAHQKEHKQRIGQIGLSGGCPVRHNSFPELGITAQAYFEALGRPDGQPQNQGESLITRASRFVCTALEISTKGSK